MTADALARKMAVDLLRHSTAKDKLFDTKISVPIAGLLPYAQALIQADEAMREVMCFCTRKPCVRRVASKSIRALVAKS